MRNEKYNEKHRAHVKNVADVQGPKLIKEAIICTIIPPFLVILLVYAGPLFGLFISETIGALLFLPAIGLTAGVRYKMGKFDESTPELDAEKAEMAKDYEGLMEDAFYYERQEVNNQKAKVKPIMEETREDILEK